MFNVSNGRLWPDREIDPHRMTTLVSEHGVGKQHMFPSDHNLRMIEAHLDSMILHVRDPRQALLSWVHQVEEPSLVERYIESNLTSREYYDLDLRDKINWQLTHQFPSVVRWLGEWIDVIEKKKIKTRILVTTFEQMKSDEQRFFENILEFYDIPRERFIERPLELTRAFGYRKGTVDEWRQVFSSDQKEKINTMLPEDVMRYFGWSY